MSRLFTAITGGLWSLSFDGLLQLFQISLKGGDFILEAVIFLF